MIKPQIQPKDHRQIGLELDLFSFHEEAPGAVFWHHKGRIIWRELENLKREILKDGYEEISTPVMVKSKLFEQSGHFEHFKQQMFNLTIDNESWSLKPMNCPESTLVYRTKIRSYKDLPIRLADFGILHRKELSGVLGGLLRVQQLTIDDAHHYVRPDQIENEIHSLLTKIAEFYKSFGFSPRFYLATKPDKAMGDVRLWKEAEKDLQSALQAAKVLFDIKPKDGAFYGPKIDIHIKDAQNRDWQLATIQLDFQMPERFKLTYIDEGGEEKQPVMLHVAFFGTFERFIGIILEHYQGALPLWLSPVQIVVIPITDKQSEYAKSVYRELKSHNIRCELDDRGETMQAKIRDATLQKVPFQVIIGDKEMEEKGTISLRTRSGENLGKVKLLDFIKKLEKEIDQKN